MIQINTIEEFKDVRDCYYCDKNGYIYSNARGKMKQMKGSSKEYNYIQVGLYVKGEKKKKNCYVQRIIASAFIPNPHNKPTVNHKNHNPQDNRVENLEWATMEEQTKSNNVWQNKHKKQMKTMQKSKSKKVMMINKTEPKVIIFQSINQCSRYLNIHSSSIIYAIENDKECESYKLKYI